MPLATSQPYAGSYLMPSIERATVGDAMHPGILSCDGDATSTEVARMMATHHIHCVAVVGLEQEALSPDHSQEPRVWGIISDFDLIGAGVSEGPEQTAAGLARHAAIIVEPSTPIRAAAQLMLTHRTGHLVVVDPGTQRPTGILSTLDIAGILAWGEG